MQIYEIFEYNIKKNRKYNVKNKFFTFISTI